MVPCQVCGPCEGCLEPWLSPCMALVDLQQLYTLILCVDRTGCSSWECTLTSVGGAKVSKSEVKRKLKPVALSKLDIILSLKPNMSNLFQISPFFLLNPVAEHVLFNLFQMWPQFFCHNPNYLVLSSSCLPNFLLVQFHNFLKGFKGKLCTRAEVSKHI